MQWTARRRDGETASCSRLSVSNAAWSVYCILPGRHHADYSPLLSLAPTLSPILTPEYHPLASIRPLAAPETRRRGNTARHGAAYWQALITPLPPLLPLLTPDARHAAGAADGTGGLSRATILATIPTDDPTDDPTRAPNPSAGTREAPGSSGQQLRATARQIAGARARATPGYGSFQQGKLPHPSRIPHNFCRFPVYQLTINVNNNQSREQKKKFKILIDTVISGSLQSTHADNWYAGATDTPDPAGWFAA